MMRLKQFRVTNFRSVEDSGWITVDDVTALIGINESGKTNLLLPLWKLNPANGEKINLLADAPRNRYNEIRSLQEKPVFIEAHFKLSDDLVSQLVALTGMAPEDVQIASVERRLDGTYEVGFPEANVVRSVPKTEISPLLEQAKAELDVLVATSKEEAIKEDMQAAIAGVVARVGETPDDVSQTSLSESLDALKSVKLRGAPRNSTLTARYRQLMDDLEGLVNQASKPGPSSNAGARQLVMDNLPSFVYYSNYGNLDSEIYLPHVIENLQRDDLGSREEAKARTLKVLFDFVKLSPQEILELGQDIPASKEPTEEEIQAVAEKKKERDVLLQSASTELTQKFRDWWKQGIYRLRFQADGNHFRIWVSDDLRPEDIELEGRSTGLQWFLSFYLVFLVESAGAHHDAILLLDEPGLSLHPLAQKDLFRFFDNLAQTNQLIYTTHSPFMVDANHLDRVRSVYVDEQGKTVASPNLRASEADPSQTKAIYAVHAALGLATSDIILQGCQPVIVEGPSDQFYFNAMKTYLIKEGLINPTRELVFVPGASFKGISAVVSVLTAKDEELPFVILDSDQPGQNMATKLRNELYKEAPDRILMIGDFCHMSDAEVEDLIPTELLGGVVTRYLRGPEPEFDEVVAAGTPIVTQVEAYAAEHKLALKEGWKVDIAKLTKNKIVKSKDPLKRDAEYAEIWKELFSAFSD